MPTKTPNDRSTFMLLLKRDTQGLIGRIVAITPENEYKKLADLATELGRLQGEIAEYLKNNYKNNEKA